MFCWTHPPRHNRSPAVAPVRSDSGVPCAPTLNTPGPGPARSARHVSRINQADMFVRNLTGRLVADWQQCQYALASVPIEVRIPEGTEFGMPTPRLQRSEQRVALVTAFPQLVDPLVWALVDTIDPDDVLRCLQPNDPVSWHCHRRYAQQP